MLFHRSPITWHPTSMSIPCQCFGHPSSRVACSPQQYRADRAAACDRQLHAHALPGQPVRQPGRHALQPHGYQLPLPGLHSHQVQARLILDVWARPFGRWGHSCWLVTSLQPSSCMDQDSILPVQPSACLGLRHCVHAVGFWQTESISCCHCTCFINRMSVQTA